MMTSPSDQYDSRSISQFLIIDDLANLQFKSATRLEHVKED